MKRLLCLVLVATALFAKDNSISKPEADDGWILLFDGDSLFGWAQQAGGRWQASNGVLASFADAGNLRSNSAFSDFALKFDYLSTGSDGDCSIFLRSAPDGDPKETGYQLQIGDTRTQWPTGSIVDYFKAEAVHPALNQWHSMEAILAADHITVKLDARQLVDGKNPRSRAGVIVIGCSRAGRVQFRNVKLKPLGMKALFNGADLSGWKAVGPPPPKKKGMLKKVIPGGGKAKEAEWSVAEGAIHAQGGEGQLESTSMYDDFLLQLAIRVNSSKKNDHPKTAVFFRGDAGLLFTGYEVPVLNEYKDRDRAHPLPGSTGGLTGLQTPRRVPVDDNEYFVETVAARGRHVQIWIDGYPVTDFQDTRAEGSSPVKDARTAVGTISLQSPDQKANLDFRNIQVAQLPKMMGKGSAEATAIQSPPITVPATAANAPVQPVMPAFPPPDPNKPKIQQLMEQAFATSDPQQQKDIYEQILKLDPNNVMAANGYQQAQQKIEAANAAHAQQEVQQQKQTQTEAENQVEAEAAREKAESAFLAGDLDTAHAQIGLAQKSLSHDNGEDERARAIAELRRRIEAAIQTRTRVRLLWGTAGLVALLGLVAALFRSRGKQDAYLEVIDGLDKGKKFNLDQEVVHIGAVAEDGGNKNEIVVRDVERMISRFHCEIHKRNGKFFLIDCGSANGTRLDGQRAKPGKPIRVKSGAKVELAGTCALRLGWEKRKNM